jgi:uncharacterized phiE125 gp8 family phage protein
MATIQRIERLTYPDVEPVTVADAKLQLRIDGTDDDDYLEIIISAAREKVETYTQRFIPECDVAVYLDTFPAANEPIDIALPDVSAIAQITYIDEDETQQTLAYGDYELDSARREIRAINDWPTDCRSVCIELAAGLDFSTSPAPDYPKPLKQAIMLYITDLYEQRGTIQNMQTYTNDAAVQLAHPFRLNLGL